MKNNMTKTAAAALTLALAGTAGSVSADANPFGVTGLDGGYKLAQASEAKCGGDKMKSKSKEGKCGESSCGASHAEHMKKSEHIDGQQHAEEHMKKAKEGSCGGNKAKAKEGKCGEGKCGGSH